MRTCLFCEGTANTKEDVWPRWLISSVGEDRTSLTEYWKNVFLPPITWHGPKFTTRHVCSDCNNGWMSQLEGTVRSTMGALINDLALPLHREEQRILAIWAAKTAMVFEGAKQDKNKFYTVEQRHGLRTISVPPPDSTVWLGRCGQSYLLHGEARKLRPSQLDGPLVDGCATTFVIRRLVIQLLSIRRKPEATRSNLKLRMKEGPWHKKLVQIWPIQAESIIWPPLESFNDLDDGLRDLRRRFTVGVSQD